MTDTERALLVAGIAATATVSAAIIAALAAYLATRRDRRRQLYGEALKAALGWREMLYRVRRRQKSNQADLVDKFHDLQEQLTYYQGWIGSESRYVARSYRRLVKAVKDGTQELITATWNEPIRELPGNALPTDEHPSFDVEADAFLRDVRGHLSPWKPRKIGVYWRNREDV